MDKMAVLNGLRQRTKPDWDWINFENQSGEWSIHAHEAFESHLFRIEQGYSESFWYGRPDRRLLNG